MFLRHTNRKKDGKTHRYFSVVENRRLSTGHIVQRTVLYLGEINDTQESAWLKTLDVFDEEDQSSRELSLFPDDREIPIEAADSLQLKLSGMDELLGVDFAVAEKDRLYRCLDRLLDHKQDLFVWLRQKWADLFAADFEVLLYDLTSTYFEGEMRDNPKAKRGYSRDGRPDCLQLVIALVITTDGFPLAYEVKGG